MTHTNSVLVSLLLLAALWLPQCHSFQIKPTTTIGTTVSFTRWTPAIMTRRNSDPNSWQERAVELTASSSKQDQQQVQDSSSSSSSSNVSDSMKERLLVEASNTCGCSDTSTSRRKKKQKAPTQLLIVAGVGILAILVAAEEGMLF